MKILITTVVSILLFSSFIAKADPLQKRPGDIILISLNCYSCPIIESSTGSPYSHSGLLIKENNQWFVLEALGKVKKTPLNVFKKYARPQTEIHLYRNLEWLNKDPDLNSKLVTEFTNNFEGLNFDGNYLWNNFEPNGDELFYCSEFITKLLNKFLRNNIPTEPMDFTDNWEYWSRHYNGNPPQGEPGNGPEVFSRSSLFQLIKAL